MICSTLPSLLWGLQVLSCMVATLFSAPRLRHAEVLASSLNFDIVEDSCEGLFLDLLGKMPEVLEVFRRRT